MLDGDHRRLLQVPKSNEKVAEIDEHIGCAMSGLTADARTLVDHGRNATQVRAQFCFRSCIAMANLLQPC